MPTAWKVTTRTGTTSLLTLQGPAERGRDTQKISLRTDESATFGVCKCGRCPFELRLAGGAAVPFTGQILAGAGRWYLRNHSGDRPLVVADVDDSVRPVTVLPGEMLPFSLDMATVSPFHRIDGVSVTVFFSPGAIAAHVSPCCPAIHPQPDPVLDPNALYVSVLTALCEPALSADSTVPMPTSSDIAAQLALTPRAVDSHIDYLIEKLAIPAPRYRGVGWKRSALIAYVRGHKNIAQALRTARGHRQRSTIQVHIRSSTERGGDAAQ
jgi:hypothetical protein